jgi:hypothetical protein
MRVSILCLFVAALSGCRATDTTSTPASSEPASSPAAPSPAAPRDAPALSLDATASEDGAAACWRLLGDPGGTLCHHIERRGERIDARHTSEAGVFELEQPGHKARRFEYQRVMSDGAAGSVYLTFLDARGEPLVILRRCNVCAEPRITEARIEREPRLTAELEAVSGDGRAW